MTREKILDEYFASEAADFRNEPVGYDWLSTFRQHFPEEFEDKNARVSIESGGERNMVQRPGGKS